MSTSNRSGSHRLPRIVLATAIAFMLLLALLLATRSDAPVRAGADGLIFLPATYGGEYPNGTYACNEYEFGLIWTGEVITLNIDGSSEYNYNPPYSAYLTGTWSYSSTLQQVTFTNFRWQTATFIPPHRLWNTQYLPGPGFDIAIDCSRH